MAEHRAVISWEREGAAFVDNRYSRGHRWDFDGGTQVAASSSPHVVPLPYSVETAVDPEEAFIAALASCHMLWFLSLAAKQGYIVDRYQDAAIGVMGRNSGGKLAMLDVTLRPAITFSGAKRPDEEQLAALHHAAHSECYLANSVKTHIHCLPASSPAAT